jgi:hypothetical protein
MAAALTLLVALTSPKAVIAANDVGRYQAIIVPQSGGGSKVLFLDTLYGNLWAWWHLDNGDTGLTYLGQLQPGTKPGDVVQHFLAALP